MFTYIWIFTVAFSIYDVDKDGYISNDDLYQILKLMIGQNKNLNDKQLQQIVDRTFMTACSDKNGKLSFEDFCKVNSSYTLLFYCKLLFEDFCKVNSSYTLLFYGKLSFEDFCKVNSSYTLLFH